MRDEKGMTALMYAAKNGQQQCLMLLLAQDAQKQDDNGKTALIHALESDNMDAAKALLAKEGDVSDGVDLYAAKLLQKIYDTKPNESFEWKGYAEVYCDFYSGSSGVQKRNAVMSGCGNEDKSVLSLYFSAAYCDRYYTLQAILSAYPYICKNEHAHSKTALMIASFYGYRESVKSLKYQEARMRYKDGRTALMYASEAGNIECVRILLDEEAEMVDNNGLTALMWAAQNVHFSHSRTICATNPKAGGHYGTALSSEEKNSTVECVKLLLKKEAGMQDNSGMTAMMYAAQNGHTEIVEMLCTREKRMRNNAGQSAIAIAQEKGYKDIFEVLKYDEEL